MRILQVCNVGNIVGGTAACAWSITRAMPEHDHHVVFRSRPTQETVQAFDPVTVEHNPAPRLLDVASDLVILHNQHDVISTEGAILSFIHSHGSNRHPGDLTVYASQWLADLYKAADPWILYQGVPMPENRAGERSDHEFIVGRFCTPQHRKWPPGVAQFYYAMANEFPQVWWAFVGCPSALAEQLDEACGGRAIFHDAGWHAREYLPLWHAMLYHNPRLTESFGRTCSEAMLAGCFPLVDPRGGFLEQIRDDAPWRVQYPQFLSFVEALHRVLDASAEQRAEWRLDMFDHASFHFSLGAFRHNLKQAISETMARHASKINGRACSTR